MGNKTISVKLDAKTHSVLKKIAVARGISVNALLSEVMTRWSGTMLPTEEQCGGQELE